MANPNMGTIELNTINSLTLPLISQKIADNITGRIPLLYLMNKIGHKEYENGGVEYRLPVLKELANAIAYSGMQVLDTVERDFITSAVFQRKLLTTDITLSGTKLLQNSGDDPTAVVNYIAAQIEIAEESMKNSMAGTSIGIFSANGESDLGITGLNNIVGSATTTGTVGGLDRATYSFWRQQTEAIAANFSTNGLVQMRALQLDTTRGEETPSVIVMTALAYANLDRALTGTVNYNQPSPKTAFGDVGFENINFKGSMVIFDDGVTASTSKFLNLKYLKLLVHQKRDMAIRDFVTPDNQDAITGRMYWAGNLVCNNLARQGILTGTGVDTW